MFVYACLATVEVAVVVPAYPIMMVSDGVLIPVASLGFLRSALAERSGSAE